MKRKTFILSLVLLVFSLSACTGPTPQATEDAIPTPSGEGLVTITGVLMRNPSSPVPVDGTVLYLAEILKSESGVQTLASYDRKTSPSAQTDSEGRFVFVDVPAKEYGLVYDLFTESYLLVDPKTQGDMIFSTESGQIYDAGELIYDSLPGDPVLEP